MSTYSFYDAEGCFVGGTFSGPLSKVGLNTPAGCFAIEGIHDPDRQRVVMADDGFGNLKPAVVQRKPVRPPDTDLVTWDWDEVADEWLARPTPVATRAKLRAVRNEELMATDGAAIAALEALVLGVLTDLGRVVPAPVRLLLDHRQALRDMPLRPDFDTLSTADVPRYLGPASSGE